MSLPTLFLKSSCPFCLKVVVFLSEAGMLNKVKMAPDSSANREMLQKIIGEGSLSFPALQLKDNEKPLMDSDGIIDLFAKQGNIDVNTLQALPYYKEGVMKGYINMIKHIGKPEVFDVIEGKKP
mmetsp:Transcript_13850/g.26884  ORF Transcript_13850/g.26884 Transcript_13850/m.26884 type:complete len:124 (-) Transcript_13850:115-486(-)|eukprot:CAMPEP_0171484802 /NCGR_PEP_ID=MMETSP0958-20121227/205_1 /TAXON_ID=87120 /ORGANISM="Aurantiochytrium limacinum, Strain ATCCMYA-1381" /LENGTH=123 /DNA_ID=CAMNT_0012017547 /DNA_START=58 /DNA_END=429 /DNA_ORIENTATION=-